MSANQDLLRAPGTQVTAFTEPTTQGTRWLLPPHTHLWEPLFRRPPGNQMGIQTMPPCY